VKVYGLDDFKKRFPSIVQALAAIGRPTVFLMVSLWRWMKKVTQRFDGEDWRFLQAEPLS